MIEDIKEMVVERLNTYYKVQGLLPTKIIYYRDGVGDSQYTQVRTDEILKLRDAYAEVYQRVYSSFPSVAEDVKITTIVVAKRHNVRFYPDPAKKSDATNTGNCKPGLLVDSVVTSPYYFDFYLSTLR